MGGGIPCRPKKFWALAAVEKALDFMTGLQHESDGLIFQVGCLPRCGPPRPLPAPREAVCRNQQWRWRRWEHLLLDAPLPARLVRSEGFTLAWSATAGRAQQQACAHGPKGISIQSADPLKRHGQTTPSTETRPHSLPEFQFRRSPSDALCLRIRWNDQEY